MAKINPEEIPKLELDLLGRYFLRATEKAFENPEIRKDYNKWLKDYKKRTKTA